VIGALIDMQIKSAGSSVPKTALEDVVHPGPGGRCRHDFLAMNSAPISSRATRCCGVGRAYRFATLSKGEDEEHCGSAVSRHGGSIDKNGALLIREAWATEARVVMKATGTMRNSA